jgi:hypothetical protein
MVFLFLFGSCNNVDSKIDNIKDDIIYLESSKESLTQDDLRDLENKIAELETDINQNRENYSDEQIRELGKLQGRYASLLFQKGVEDFKGSVKDIGKQLEGFVEGMQDNSNK